MAGNAQLSIAIRAVNEASRQLKDVQGDINKVAGSAEKAEKSSRGFGSALGSVAKIAGGFIVAQGLLKIPGILGGAMDAASNFNETLSKSNTVFKTNAAEVEKWASTAATNFGQSKTQALDAAGAFGNMFIQMGIGSDVAADMSMSMTELASDFASFHNADITEVITAQSAAFRGEYDALQRFVPTINAAAVEQEALAMTGKKLTKELTIQEKALAVNALMMKGAGDAAGDFDRTSDGAANKSRILEARMADLSVTIGQKLLPVKVALLGILLDHVIPAFETFWGVATRVGSAIGEVLAPVLGAVRDFLVDIAGAAWDKINGPLGTFADVMLRFGEGAIATAINLLSNVVVPALRALVALTWEGLNAGFTTFVDTLQRIADSGAVDTLKQQVADLSAKLQASGGDQKTYADLWENIHDKIQPAIDFIWPSLRSLLLETRQALADVGRELGPLAQAMRDLWNAIEPLHPLLKVLAEFVATYVVIQLRILIETLRIAIQVLSVALVIAIRTATSAIQTIATVIEGVVTAVQGSVGFLVLVFESMAGKIKLAVSELPTWFYDIGKGIITGLWNGVLSLKDWFINQAKQIGGWIESAIPDWIPHSPPPAAVAIGEGIPEGIAVGIENNLYMIDAATGLIRQEFLEAVYGFVPAAEEAGEAVSTAFGGALSGRAALAYIDITTGLLTDAGIAALYDSVPDFEAAGAAAATAFGSGFAKNTDWVIGPGGSLIPPGTVPVNPTAPGEGGFNWQGGAVMTGADGIPRMYNRTTGEWEPITGDNAYVDKGGSPGVSTPSLRPVPGYDWQFYNGKWQLVPAGTIMDFGGGSYTGPGGTYTGASWQPTTIVVNALDAQSFQQYLQNGGGEQIATYFNARTAY